MITVPGTNGIGSGLASQSVTINALCKKLVVCAGVHQGSISNVQLNGVALTKVSPGATTPNNERGEIWYMDNPPAGTYTLLVSGSGSTRMAGWIQLEGDPKTGAPDVSAVNNGDSPYAFVAITPTNGNSIVICSSFSEAPRSSTGAGETLLYSRQDQSYQNGMGSYNIQSSPVAETMDFNLNYGSRWAIQAIAISPDATPPPTTNALLFSGE